MHAYIQENIIYIWEWDSNTNMDTTNVNNLKVYKHIFMLPNLYRHGYTQTWVLELFFIRLPALEIKIISWWSNLSEWYKALDK